MFVKMSYLKIKFRNQLFKIINFIENNGNSNFETNGEKLFINNLLRFFCKDNYKKRTIFDIGANNGQFSIMVEDKSLELNMNIDLHLFEPTRKCFSVVYDKFKNKNIKLNNFGISDKEGSAYIHYNKEGSELASLYQRNLVDTDFEFIQSEEIKLRRMDTYIEELNIKHIDFVKIDIEGHELSAFNGFGKYINGDFIDFIQFEYGGCNLDSKTSLLEIYQFLLARNFKIGKILSNGLEMRDYAEYMEDFNYSNYVAISNKVLDK